MFMFFISYLTSLSEKSLLLYILPVASSIITIFPALILSVMPQLNFQYPITPLKCNYC